MSDKQISSKRKQQKYVPEFPKNYFREMLTHDLRLMETDIHISVIT